MMFRIVMGIYAVTLGLILGMALCGALVDIHEQHCTHTVCPDHVVHIQERRP